jgi:hypothetical protein
MTHESDPNGASKRAAPYVPMLRNDDADDFIGIVLVRNHAEKDGEIEPGLPVWILEMAFAEDARERYEWMLTRPERWAVWGRLAPIVGSEMLTLMMEGEQDEDVRLAAELQAQADRVAREARTVTALTTEVDGRPCVTLDRNSDIEPFLVIMFDEAVERDRLWDWLRWQPHRYRGWRMLWDEKGPAALRRLIVESMLHDEHRARQAGHAIAGPRPLRLWDGGRRPGSASPPTRRG